MLVQRRRRCASNKTNIGSTSRVCWVESYNAILPNQGVGIQSFVYKNTCCKLYIWNAGTPVIYVSYVYERINI